MENLGTPKARMSKTRRPKLTPEHPIQPNLFDGYQTLAYLYQRAEMGEFDGSPASALSVVIYLANFTWRKEPNDENAPIGQVMAGKSPIGKIADSLGLSYRTVQRALDWLAEAGWIDVERRGYGDGSRAPHQITVRLDISGHNDRQRVASQSRQVASS